MSLFLTITTLCLVATSIVIVYRRTTIEVENPIPPPPLFLNDFDDCLRDTKSRLPLTVEAMADDWEDATRVLGSKSKRRGSSPVQRMLSEEPIFQTPGSWEPPTTPRAKSSKYRDCTLSSDSITRSFLRPQQRQPHPEDYTIVEPTGANPGFSTDTSQVVADFTRVDVPL